MKEADKREHRYRVFSLPMDFWRDFFIAQSSYDFITVPQLVVEVDQPDGTKKKVDVRMCDVVACERNFWSQCFEFLLYHPDFPVAPDGAQIPRFEGALSLEMRAVRLQGANVEKRIKSEIAAEARQLILWTLKQEALNNVIVQRMYTIIEKGDYTDIVTVLVETIRALVLAGAGERIKEHLRKENPGLDRVAYLKEVEEMMHRQQKSANILFEPPTASNGTCFQNSKEIIEYKPKVHFSRAPFKSACGFDEPNAKTSPIIASVTCPECKKMVDAPMTDLTANPYWFGELKIEDVPSAWTDDATEVNSSDDLPQPEIVKKSEDR